MNSTGESAACVKSDERRNVKQEIPKKDQPFTATVLHLIWCSLLPNWSQVSCCREQGGGGGVGGGGGGGWGLVGENQA